MRLLLSEKDDGDFVLVLFADHWSCYDLLGYIRAIRHGGRKDDQLDDDYDGS